ncbi:hypothetical protein F53441_4779 [Fusarium austroafricanum]|uniref:C2H2-type domain-containing protein n=1 Tax=Fusarium austroafricanum TaxID=2364996 RepID=A0A8H4NYF7_9HYPO|nr:hypothetical protein F53441_4779 [Fusarium austroafricanum]
MDSFEWHDAAWMTSGSQDQEGETNPGYLLSVADPREIQYNFGIHPPQFGSPYAYPMTAQLNADPLLFERYSTDTIPIQLKNFNMPATAQSLGICNSQSNNQQWGYQAIDANSQASLLQLPPMDIYPPMPAMRQHNGMDFSIQPDHAATDTVMVDAGIMPGCPAAPGNQPFEKMICPVKVAKSRVRAKKKNSQEKWPKTWHERWEPWREIIKYLKLGQGHTFSELAFEMSSVHGFNFEVSTYQKLGQKWDEFKPDKTKDIDEFPVKKDSSRRRGAAISPKESKRNLHIFKCMVDSQRFRSDNRLLQVPSVPEFYQYKILHSMDILVKKLFDQKRGYGWSANKTTLTLSNQSLVGSATKSLAAWQSLYDKCSGIASLYEGHVMKGTLRRIKVLLDRVLVQVKATEYSCDPHMLLYIWKVCETLIRVNFKERQWSRKYVLVRIFLRSLKARLSDLGFQGSDYLVVIVDSLFSILDSTPRDFKRSLGLGCWKFMEILGSQIGNDHFIVLNIGMYCNRTWGNIWGLVDIEGLQARYNPHLLSSNGDIGALIAQTSSEREGEVMNHAKLERIEFLHTSGLALRDVLSSLKFKRGEDQTRTKHINVLLNLTDHICLELVNLARAPCKREADQEKLAYTTATRALAFALEQLAFDLHEKATTEELDTRKRKKIRKTRNEIAKKAKLGQLTRTANEDEAAIKFSVNPEDITRIYEFMDDAINILRNGDKDCKLRAAQISRQRMTWMGTYSLGEKISNRRGRSKGKDYERERDRADEILASIFPKESLETKENERRQFRRIIVKDANIEEPPMPIRPRRSHKKVAKDSPTPMPRTCEVCGKVFKSRNKLFEQHLNVDGACHNDWSVPRDDLVSHQNPDPFMGYSSPRGWE